MVGLLGLQGSQGPQGRTGTQGFQGHTGMTGAQGFQGPMDYRDSGHSRSEIFNFSDGFDHFHDTFKLFHSQNQNFLQKLNGLNIENQRDIMIEIDTFGDTVIIDIIIDVNIFIKDKNIQQYVNSKFHTLKITHKEFKFEENGTIDKIYYTRTNKYTWRLWDTLSNIRSFLFENISLRCPFRGLLLINNRQYQKILMLYLLYRFTDAVISFLPRELLFDICKYIPSYEETINNNSLKNETNF